MEDPRATCWSVIEGAAAGRSADREEFARLYEPLVRSYLGARWRGSALAGEVDDAVQEVFLDLFRDGGALSRVDPSREGGFRAYFYGVLRNAALHVETRRARNREHPHDRTSGLEDLPSREESLSRIFDRSWALSLLREAMARHDLRARGTGEAAVKRVELLRLRFGEDLPVRAIAERWSEDPARVHREYALAREEFRDALLEVVAFHLPGTPGEVARESARLLALLR